MADTDHGVRTVAVIGTGVIGASWASCFLARGLHVRATDPAPGAEAALRRRVTATWPAMEALGLVDGAARDRLVFVDTPEAAVTGADFVQENGPEDLEIKKDLFRRLDAAAAPGVVLSSSSSFLMPSLFQNACAEPGRVLLGHPFNPPHLIPLVEVVGGAATTEQAIQRAMDFYAMIGKRPVRLKREFRGHIANRLQAALWREAAHIVREGVATIADVDVAVAHGPGLRWALLGAFFNLHLSGGEAGMAHTLSHLGPSIEAMWRELGAVELDAEMRETILAGTAASLEGLSIPEIVRQRDAVLIEVLRLKAASTLP